MGHNFSEENNPSKESNFSDGKFSKEKTTETDKTNQQEIELNIQFFTSKKLTIYANRSDKISSLVRKIEEMENQRYTKPEFIYNTQVLQLNKTIQFYQLTNGSTISFSFQL